MSTRGWVTLNSSANQTIVQLSNSTSNGGYISLNRANGSAAVVIATTATAGEDGFLQTLTSAGKPLIVLTSLSNSPAGSLAVYGADGNMKLWLAGDGNKNFIMPHPLDPSKEIMYACLEGPEVAAYCRGRAALADGHCEVAFPDHFALVANPDTLTVQVTPRSADSKGLAVIAHSAKGFVVEELGGGKGAYDFDYFVSAVRRGHEHFVPVVPKGQYAVPPDETTSAQPAAGAAGAPAGPRFEPRLATPATASPLPSEPSS
jgi:hypothetical protein